MSQAQLHLIFEENMPNNITGVLLSDVRTKVRRTKRMMKMRFKVKMTRRRMKRHTKAAKKRRMRRKKMQ